MTLKGFWMGFVEAWPLVTGMGCFAASVALLWLRSRFTPRTETASLSMRVDALEKRQAEIAMLLEHLPRGEDLYGLKLAISDIQGKQETISVQIKATGDAMHRLETQITLMTQHLLEYS